MTKRPRCPTTRKWGYETSADALVAAVVRYANVGRGQTQRAYACPFCGLYHLTTSPRSRGSRRTEKENLG